MGNTAQTPTSSTPTNMNLSNGSAAAAGGLLGGLFSLIGTAIQGQYNNEENWTQRIWEERMMKKQNDWNLDMWNKTNEYNSPAEQLERLRDAGLNPMFYGLDGTAANTMQSASNNGVAPAYMNHNPLGDISRVLQENLSQIPIKQAQQELMKSEAEKNYAEADDLRSNTTDREETRPYRIQLLGEEIVINADRNKREAERHIKELQEKTQNIINMNDANERAWKELDIKERHQSLEESHTLFSELMSQSELSLKEKELMVDWYNAGSARMQAETNKGVGEATIFKINEEGNLIKEEVKLKAEDVAHYEQRFKQEMKNQKINNVIKCIDTGLNAIDTGVNAYSSIMTGGLANAQTKRVDSEISKNEAQAKFYRNGGSFVRTEIHSNGNTHTYEAMPTSVINASSDDIKGLPAHK